MAPRQQQRRPEMLKVLFVNSNKKINISVREKIPNNRLSLTRVRCFLEAFLDRWQLEMRHGCEIGSTSVKNITIGLRRRSKIWANMIIHGQNFLSKDFYYISGKCAVHAAMCGKFENNLESDFVMYAKNQIRLVIKCK
jgi:hypothetical protein